MAELSDIVTLTTISSTRANLWQSRLVQRYSSVANRTTEHPSPAEGDLSYLEDSNSIWVYDGTSWLLLGPNLEVDDHDEVNTSTQLTTSLVAYATVNLTIPTTWASWKCEAYATCSLTVNVGANTVLGVRIDGTDLNPQATAAASVAVSFPGAVGGRRTGLTTTGSRSISLMALNSSGSNVATINDRYLYARATRTS